MLRSRKLLLHSLGMLHSLPLKDFVFRNSLPRGVVVLILKVRVFCNKAPAANKGACTRA